MNILIVTPAAPGSQTGNRITAERWANHLRELGHRVWIATAYGTPDEEPELLIALHARKSADSVERFCRKPRGPVIVALTGTDLYGDIRSDEAAQRTLEVAWRLIALQPKGIDELPRALRTKARVIIQSAPTPEESPAPLEDCFEVCVSGHLRPVKDPFRAAEACRLLPSSSRIRITHLGAALEPAMEERARAELVANPRYQWLGGVPRTEALKILWRSRLLVLSSCMEGGANVVCEALAGGVPVIASRIGGSIGLLGEDYPGYFAVGDTSGLAALLERAETEAPFYAALREHCAGRRDLVAPEREREAWRALLRELGEG